MNETTSYLEAELAKQREGSWRLVERYCEDFAADDFRLVFARGDEDGLVILSVGRDAYRLFDAPAPKGGMFVSRGDRTVSLLLAEVERMRQQHDAILVVFYRRDAFACAVFCDEVLDRSGDLLRRVRERAAGKEVPEVLRSREALQAIARAALNEQKERPDA